MKKFMALLLTLAMTASFTAVPVIAQDEDVIENYSKCNIS